MKREENRSEIIDHKKGIILREKIENNDSISPSKPISMRGRSLSFSAPIHRDICSSLPESPASKFLAEFLYKDDIYETPQFEDGTALNQYVVGQTLGGGAYSVCREAYVLNNRESSGSNIPDKVALKIITDPRYMQIFKKELIIWSHLRHPNILPLLDSFSGEGYMVAVSVLAEFGNLQAFISKNGKMTEDMALRLFGQIVSAVHYLHDSEKIAHLDIKLENILFRKNHDIYLCDFGTSFKFSNSFKMPEILDEADNNQFCIGSVTSLPPEVFSSSFISIKCSLEESFEMKKRQDIWALGICLYAMVTGRLPFNDEFLPRLQYSILSGKYRPIPDTVSIGIKVLISKLLSKIPEERPSIKEVLDQIGHLNKCKNE